MHTRADLSLALGLFGSLPQRRKLAGEVVLGLLQLGVGGSRLPGRCLVLSCLLVAMGRARWRAIGLGQGRVEWSGVE